MESLLEEIWEAVKDADTARLDRFIAHVSQCLEIAKACRQVLGDGLKPPHPRPIGLKPGRTSVRTPGRKVARNGSGVIATAKTKQVAEVLLTRGALDTAGLAKHLRWKEHAVRMVLSRNKRNFDRRPDGTYLVSAELTRQLEED